MYSEKSNIIKNFVQEDIEHNIRYIRVIFSFFAIVYGMFAVLDYSTAGVHLKEFLIIRFAIVIPYYCFVILISFTKFFITYSQIILSIAVLLSGFGIAYMLIVQPENTPYYGGLFMIIFSQFFLLNIYYIYSILCFSGIFIYLVSNFFIFHGNTDTDNIYYMMFFYFFSGIIGTVGSYFMNSYKFSNYISTKKLLEQENNLIHLVDDKVAEITESQFATIYALAKIVEARDQSTGTHVENVGGYCKIIAENLSDDLYSNYNIEKTSFIETLVISSALHDLGKVAISDVILNKPGALTKEEFEIIKQHPSLGSQHLEVVLQKYKNNEFIRMGIDISKYHHERWDGTGYPSGLKGNEIPLSAQIMAIADVYDALTSTRPYKKALEHDQAVFIITKEEHGHFSPYIVEAFFNNNKSFLKYKNRGY